jgi:hypothetical protein
VRIYEWKVKLRTERRVTNAVLSRIRGKKGKVIRAVKVGEV